MPDFVKLVNTDPFPFDYHYHDQKHYIQPGGEKVVPWNLATTLFGDPSQVDLPREELRTKTYKRIRGMFNHLEGVETTDEWEERRPHIHVYDLDTNERIYMVIEDPRGEKMPTFADNGSNLPSSDVEALTRQIASLTNLVSQLMSDRTHTATPAEGNVATVSIDGPDVDPVDPGLPPSEFDPATFDPVGFNPTALPPGFNGGGAVNIDLPIPSASEDSPQAVPTLAPRP